MTTATTRDKTITTLTKISADKKAAEKDLSRLREKQRDAILHAIDTGVSVTEIAEHSQLSRRGVYSLIARRR